MAARIPYFSFLPQVLRARQPALVRPRRP